MSNTTALSGGERVSTNHTTDIAELARRHAGKGLDNIHPFMDFDWLKEAYERTRKDGAPGVDGVTWNEYGKNLYPNLTSLLQRAKSGSYRAPPVKRAYMILSRFCGRPDKRETADRMIHHEHPTAARTFKAKRRKHTKEFKQEAIRLARQPDVRLSHGQPKTLASTRTCCEPGPPTSTRKVQMLSEVMGKELL